MNFFKPWKPNSHSILILQIKDANLKTSSLVITLVFMYFNSPLGLYNLLSFIIVFLKQKCLAQYNKYG